MERYRRPAPRLGLRHALRDAAHAAMDLSDGLAKDLGRMCRVSGCGARVVASRLPLSHAAGAAIAADPVLFARVISAGDDYEILAAVAPTAAETFERRAAAAGVAVTDVGAFTASVEVEIVEDDGRPLGLTTPGYDHF
jgi:thiamine-monophosphate kinase